MTKSRKKQSRKKKTLKKQSPEQQSPEDWLDSIDPSTIEMRDGRHVRAIAAAREALKAAELELERVVADAKDAGESWAVIGLALGTSRQAAHRKFSR